MAMQIALIVDERVLCNLRTCGPAAKDWTNDEIDRQVEEVKKV
jgi:hypothetical protein